MNKCSAGTITLGYSAAQSYATVVNTGQNPPLSESFDLTYDGLNRVSTVTRDSDNQVVTYSYDASTGRPSSVNLSDEGTFSFSYLSNGKLESVTYPGQQGTEDYSYDSEGLLQSIEFPDNNVLGFTRDHQFLHSAQFTDSQNTVFRYDFTYDDQANLISSNYSIDSLQMESWSYYWGPQGLEYASRSGGQAITQNFSTDPTGRILSMTYGSASYSGELYYHYDALGNTTLLTDAGRNPKASFIYDLHTGKIIDSWNPDNLVIINLEQGIGGNLRFELPEGITIGITSKVIGGLRARPVFKGKIPKWAEDMDLALFNEDGTPVFRIRLAFSWGLGAFWCDALDTDEPPSYEVYNPNRIGLNSGGGGGTESKWKNYENCMHNCFAGENLGRLTKTPSTTASDNWKSWIQERSNIFRNLVNFPLIVAMAILVFLLSAYAKDFIATLSLADLVLKGLDFINKAIAGLIEYHLIPIAISSWNNFYKVITNLSGAFLKNFHKEMECRALCNQYSPDPSVSRYWFLLT